MKQKPVAYIGTVPGHPHTVIGPEGELMLYPCGDPKCPLLHIQAELAAYKEGVARLLARVESPRRGFSLGPLWTAAVMSDKKSMSKSLRYIQSRARAAARKA